MKFQNKVLNQYVSSENKIILYRPYLKSPFEYIIIRRLIDNLKLSAY